MQVDRSDRRPLKVLVMVLERPVGADSLPGHVGAFVLSVSVEPSRSGRERDRRDRPVGSSDLESSEDGRASIVVGSGMCVHHSN